MRARGADRFVPTGDEPETFEQFAQRLSPRLSIAARAMTTSEHDAWDLLQDTFVRVAEKWGRVAMRSPEAYARTTMARLNIDRVRRLRREVLSHSPPEPPQHPPGSELAGWLIEALRTLSPKQRTAVALRHVEDLTVEQIAERLGCSVGTAKSHLSRGTARLQQQLPSTYDQPKGGIS